MRAIDADELVFYLKDIKDNLCYNDPYCESSLIDKYRDFIDSLIDEVNDCPTITVKE